MPRNYAELTDRGPAPLGRTHPIFTLYLLTLHFGTVRSRKAANFAQNPETTQFSRHQHMSLTPRSNPERTALESGRNQKSGFVLYQMWCRSNCSPQVPERARQNAQKSVQQDCQVVKMGLNAPFPAKTLATENSAGPPH
jgi:hypothetical protein